MPQKRYIAIDGGGTKTAFAVFDATGNITEQKILGPTNPNDIGMEQCLACLTQGLDLPGVEPTAVFAGIAGAGVGENKSRIAAFLAERFPHAAAGVESDGIIALAAEPACDAVLIAGTGSVLFVKTKEGPCPIGGWGYLLEQGGSAYSLGRDALMAALSAEEGIGPATVLTDLMIRRLGSPLRGQLSPIYQGGKVTIAALAPLVFDALAVGDEKANTILRDHCKQMQHMIKTAHARYGASHIALCGGLFAHQTAVLLPMLRGLCPDVTLSDTPALPLLGAAREAMRLADEVIPPDFSQNFKKSYQKG